MKLAKLFIGIICIQLFVLKSNAAIKDSVSKLILPYVQSIVEADTTPTSNLINGFLQLPDSLNPQSVYNYYNYDTLHLSKIDLTQSSFSDTKNIITELPQLRPLSPENWLFYLFLLNRFSQYILMNCGDLFLT